MYIGRETYDMVSRALHGRSVGRLLSDFLQMYCRIIDSESRAEGDSPADIVFFALTCAPDDLLMLRAAYRSIKAAVKKGEEPKEIEDEIRDMFTSYEGAPEYNGVMTDGTKKRNLH